MRVFLSFSQAFDFFNSNFLCLSFSPFQTLADDAELDDGLKIVHYERTYDQNEELGINDMKTENYENDA